MWELMLRDAINKIDAEIAQLEREIAEDRYNQSKVYVDNSLKMSIECNYGSLSQRLRYSMEMILHL